MKIDDRNLNGPTAAESGRTSEMKDSNRGGPAASTDRPGSVDRAEISKVVERIAADLTTHAIERSQQVAKLAKQFSLGQYNADSRAVSRSIIRDAIEGTDAAR